MSFTERRRFLARPTIGTLPDIEAPSAPVDGVTVFSADIAGRSMLSTIDSTGIPMPLQASMAFMRVGTWTATLAATTPSSSGVTNSATISVGTGTTRAITGTSSLALGAIRIGLVSGAGAASAAVLRGGSAGRFHRDVAGGFFVAHRFNISDASLVSTANMFVGISGASIAADALPSTFTNVIGIGCDSGDTVMQLYASGASAQARVSLGANFPVNTTDTDVYELTLYAVPSGTSVSYRVRRLGTAFVATGTISVSANLPSSTTALNPHYFRGNGATAAAVGLDFHQSYFETTY